MTRGVFQGLVVIAAALMVQSGSAQLRSIDPERVLTERFGFTAEELAQLAAASRSPSCCRARTLPRSACWPPSASTGRPIGWCSG